MFAVVVAVLVWQRGRREGAGGAARGRHPAVPVVAAVGVAVGLVSGMLGLGGPMLSVPLLLALGVGVLEALAAAQVQSIVIASVGTIGYALHGSVDWPLVGLIGLPELAGVIIGWRIARALPTGRCAASSSPSCCCWLRTWHCADLGFRPAFPVAGRGGLSCWPTLAREYRWTTSSTSCPSSLSGPSSRTRPRRGGRWGCWWARWSRSRCSQWPACSGW